MSDESKYEFTETTQGFFIEARDRCTVRVVLMPTYIHVEGGGHAADFGFFEYYRLSAYIADVLMQNWKPPLHLYRLPDGREIMSDEYTPRWLRPWAVGQTAKAIGRRVYAQWQRLLAMACPAVLAVQRAIFAATCGAGAVAISPELYQADGYILGDILNYRAAAIAARNCTELARDSRDAMILHSQPAEQLRALADSLGVRVDISCWNHVRTTAEGIDAMHNWRGLFSPTGESYRSLDRTLMNLPGGVPHSLVCNLVHTRLERPVTNRLELTSILFHAIREKRHNEPVFYHARAPQIAEAMRRVATHTRNDLSPRKTRDVKFLVQFLADYPDDHAGSIVGLADKAIVWHRDERQRDAARQAEQLGPDRAVMAPPVPLPQTDNISFLATVGDVCWEGIDMQHCVASYAKEAAEGRCYLFHIDYKGEKATVQVDRFGKVVQAHGPSNQRNKAAGWGKRMLSRWGTTFPDPAMLPEPAWIELPQDENIPF
ncbi:MAG: PcfJ domain-containing protein [Thermoflexales bacterium]|nr:PcfJ domain-containing protein [Thermoflexales bacterium]